MEWMKPPYPVRDRVVLITGAGQGIGAETARLLHARGAEIAVVDIDTVAAESLAKSLGDRAFPVTADVADRGEMASVIEEVVNRFGQLDVVVANAGVVPAPATLRSMDASAFDRVLDINLTGVFNTVHPALDHVIRARGHIVVVSSCAAFAPGMGGAPYMISKAGVEQLGRALRVELSAHRATAGIAYFGIVDTAMTRNTLDDNEIGRRLEELLPWPLKTRITAEQAARTIADGIEHRAARTIAPAGWQPYALFRGLINTVLDGALTRDPRVHALLREVEARTVVRSR
ncbi:SDR family oxidoreductase [Nocardia yamanashiensis]|uniref:SDR family oxidoreductase n=1 Tax=Nocardia yamanashiensis TaxID=209247 RepID=UPI001E366AB9|nr:SDR family oxidoreductase [Nocardia yamanashiensis]UGT43447.1 SDR family oxidoreductase [Nocardia yamanashiensis]